MSLRTILKVIALAAAMSLASPAMAQNATGSSVKLSKSHIDVALELVKLLGLTKTFDVIVPQLGIRIINNVTRTRPELKKDLDAVLNKLVPEFDKEQAQLIEKTTRYFAEAMNEKDIGDTVAFFKSKAGKQFLLTQPKVLDRMVVSIDDWNRDLSERMLERVRAEMKKKGHDL